MAITQVKTIQNALTAKAKKAALGQYRRLIREIRAYRLHLASLDRRLIHKNPLDAAEQDGALTAEEIRAVRRRLQENLDACQALLHATEQFIDRMADSELRQIFTLRYIDGKTWQEIAFAIGGFDESVPRKKHDRYLASISL